jgi:phosphoglycolate phosphatase-like HAD superfamily hydrolase
VRYPNVLFDLDGTLIDSGAIILASFRHATRTVLAREIPDAELAALVGGSNIHDQMRAIDADRVDELVRVYREHNEPLHSGARDAGSASSRRSGARPSTSRSPFSRSSGTSTPSSPRT